MSSIVFVSSFKSYEETIPSLLKATELASLLNGQKKIILKPNLTDNYEPPVTTNVRMVEEVIKFCQANSKADIIVGEGSGGSDTSKCFRDLGYYDLADKYGIELVDLNKAETTIIKNENAEVFKEFHLPIILKDSFLISIPVLKEHGIATVTISMKNMMGIAPSKYYGIFGNHWLKTKYHIKGVDRCVVDTILQRKPDFSIVDAVICQIGGEIHGQPKSLYLIFAGQDPVAIDSYGAKLLGHKPEDVKHIKMAEEKGLGTTNFKLKRV